MAPAEKRSPPEVTTAANMSLLRSYLPLAAAVAILALALAMRLYYVTHAVVVDPVRGDASEYVSYAQNLANSGIFAKTPSGSTIAVADSFRDPGYPFLLSLVMRIFPQGTEWYAAMLVLQALLGAATVGMTMFIGWRWLGPRTCVLAGALMAIWPHSITITSFILSETLYSFLLVAAIAVLIRARSIYSPWRAVTSGILFAAAALTNAVATPLAAVLCVMLVAGNRSRWRLYAYIFVASLVPLLAWGWRNAALESPSTSGTRVAMNLIQGSWPNYHDAYRATFSGDPTARAALGVIDGEVAAASGKIGVAAKIVSQRIAKDPGHYLAWYASKPYLLWDWRLRMGQNDVYQYPTINSPFDISTPWRLLIALCKGINPLLFFFAGAATIAALVRQYRETAGIVAIVLTFATIVHVVLQAEPRYSIPLRPLEILMAASALERITYLYAKSRSQNSTLSTASHPAKFGTHAQ